MILTTPAGLTESTTVEGVAPATWLIVFVEDDSPANLNIKTGFPLKVDGVLTEDTSGMTVPAGGSIALPATNVYSFSTNTEGTGANFQVLPTR